MCRWAYPPPNKAAMSSVAILKIPPPSSHNTAPHSVGWSGRGEGREQIIMSQNDHLMHIKTSEKRTTSQCNLYSRQLCPNFLPPLLPPPPSSSPLPPPPHSNIYIFIHARTPRIKIQDPLLVGSGGVVRWGGWGEGRGKAQFCYVY